MFEDISDPSRNSPPRDGNALYPSDSVGASYHVRFDSVLLSVVVVADAAENRGADPAAVLLRDGALLVLLALVWILRSPVVAAVICGINLISPLVYADRPWSPVLLLCLWLLWMCILFRRFRKQEASATPPDDSAQPETPS